MPITKARINLGAVVKNVSLNKKPVILNRDGYPVAAIIDIDKLEEIMDRADLIEKKRYENKFKSEYVNCNNCGANDTELLLSIGSGDFVNSCVQCKKCGLIYTNPQPSENYLKKIYSKSYFDSKDNNIGYASYKNEKKIRINRFKKYFNIIEKHIVKKKRVLDIGAGFGYFLEEAKKRKWEKMQGVEVSEYARSQASELFGLSFVDNLNKIPLTPKYNLITMFDFIEHIKNPSKTLKRVSNLIGKDGLLVIRVPVIDSAEGIRKGKFFFRVDHLYNFSKNIICEMIKRSGFDILEITDEPAHIIIIARKNK